MIKQLYKRMLSEKSRVNLRHSLQKKLSFLYRGNTYTCNCCEKSFRKFLPKGNIPRPNAQCPNCGSLERTRLLLFYLQRETEIFNAPMTVLHIAPEKCLKDGLLKQKSLEYIDGDINPALASHVVDLTDIPYPDNYFDLIICSHVLGHIPDEAKALREMQRVIKGSGSVLIMTLIDKNRPITYENPDVKSPEERLAHYGESDLCRLHGQDFSDSLKNAGFDVSVIDYREKFSLAEQEKYRLGNGERELIFKGVKSGEF